MFPLFRFTLSNDTEGDLEISDPGGWDTAKIKLERNEKYHSLVELYDQPFTFYGEDNTHNGGLDYIRDIEETQGVDADIRIKVEVNFGDGYDVLFVGLLDLSQIKEVDFYKADIPVLRDDFWTKFINRESTPVDVQSTTDLDGNDVDVIDPLELTLTSQKINKVYDAYLKDSFAVDESDWNTNRYVQLSMDTIVLDELKTSFIIPNTWNTEIPAWIFEFKENGVYAFDIKIESVVVYYTAGGTPPNCTSTRTITSSGAYIDYYIQKNEEAPVALTKTTNTVGYGSSTTYSYLSNVSVNTGDIFRIYGDITANISALGNIATYVVLSTNNSTTVQGMIQDAGTCAFLAGTPTIFDIGVSPSGLVNPTYFNINAATEFDDTVSETLLLHDVSHSIIKRISGADLYSEYLGGGLITTQGYDTDGCGYPFVLLDGLHIRQYTFTEKPFFKSHSDLWDGVNPIFCLGLGYEELSPVGYNFLNQSFEVSLTNWEQNASAGQVFNWNSGAALADGSSSGLSSTAKIGQANTWPAGQYSIEIDVFNDSTGGLTPFQSALQIFVSNNSIGDGSEETVVYDGDGIVDVGTSKVIKATFELTESWEYLYFNFYKVGPSSGYECYISISSARLVSYRIRIEHIEHFYDSSDNSVNLSNVNNIERSYLTDSIYKKINIGYQKWESENVSGIDDPQTKHTYTAAFKKVGEEIELYSKFIAASYAIESTRRQVLEKSKDYRLDNDTFIIAINPTASPVQPELDENFTSITGLNNSDTRYNLRLTPMWNFTRWLKRLSCSFRPLTSAFWKFVDGEGNFDVTYQTSDTCLTPLSDPINEGSDLEKTLTDSDSIHGLTVYEFEHPLSWEDYKTIRNNRNKSIGISRTSSFHESFFILSLEYEITKSKAKFRVVKSINSAEDFILAEGGGFDGFMLETEDGFGLLIE